MNNIDPKMLQALLNGANGKIDPNIIKSAINGKNANDLLKSLSLEDRNKINSILANKTAMEKLMQNPQVMDLIKKFSAGGKNG